MTDEPDAAYFRRRFDNVMDIRVSRLEHDIQELDRKLDALSVRVAVIAAIISLVTLVANIIGPVIAIRLLNGP